MVARYVRTYPDAAAVVYIVHSAEGGLLYVGVTRNLRVRMSAHKWESAWWAPDNVVTVEHFEKRDDAERREVELIEALSPPFNWKHSAKSRELARRQRRDARK